MRHDGRGCYGRGPADQVRLTVKGLPIYHEVVIGWVLQLNSGDRKAVCFQTGHSATREVGVRFTSRTHGRTSLMAVMRNVLFSLIDVLVR